MEAVTTGPMGVTFMAVRTRLKYKTSSGCLLKNKTTSRDFYKYKVWQEALDQA
jgi:hypothetical protein